jgi:hypothetical protein
MIVIVYNTRIKMTRSLDKIGMFSRIYFGSVYSYVCKSLLYSIINLNRIKTRAFRDHILRSIATRTTRMAIDNVRRVESSHSRQRRDSEYHTMRNGPPETHRQINWMLVIPRFANDLLL